MQDEELEKDKKIEDIKNEYYQVYGRESFNDANDTETDTKQKDINYKDYLNTVIQEYNMLEKSKKYLNNDLANQGLASQDGYSSSAQIQMDANLRNQYAQAASNYEDKQLQVSQERQEQIDSDNASLIENMVGMISSIADSDLSESEYNDKIGQYLENAGLDKDTFYNSEKKEWDFSKLKETEMWNSLSETDKFRLSATIDDMKVSAAKTESKATAVENAKTGKGLESKYKTDADGNVVRDNNGHRVATGITSDDIPNWGGYYSGTLDKNGKPKAMSIDELRECQVGGNDNTSTKSLKTLCPKELNTLSAAVQDGSIPAGSLVEIENNYGCHESYLIFVGENNTYYVVSNDDREESTSPNDQHIKNWTGEKFYIHKGWLCDMGTDANKDSTPERGKTGAWKTY